LILRELSNGTGLSAEKRAVFQTALSSLSENIQTQKSEQSEPLPWGLTPLQEQEDLLECPALPPASLMQWLLQGKLHFLNQF